MFSFSFFHCLPAPNDGLLAPNDGLLASNDSLLGPNDLFLLHRNSIDSTKKLGKSAFFDAYYDAVEINETLVLDYANLRVYQSACVAWRETAREFVMFAVNQ